MNCLEYALEFWEKNPRYELWYNSDHVINLPEGSGAGGFRPIEDFGYENILSSFRDVISENSKKLLKKYFEIQN